MVSGLSCQKIVPMDGLRKLESGARNPACLVFLSLAELSLSVAVTAFDKATVVAKSGFESQWSQTTLHSNLLYKVL